MSSDISGKMYDSTYSTYPIYIARTVFMFQGVEEEKKRL